MAKQNVNHIFNCIIKLAKEQKQYKAKQLMQFREIIEQEKQQDLDIRDYHGQAASEIKRAQKVKEHKLLKSMARTSICTLTRRNLQQMYELELRTRDMWNLVVL